MADIIIPRIIRGRLVFVVGPIAFLAFPDALRAARDGAEGCAP